MKKNYVNFVLTADKNYIIPLGTVMHSIVHNLSPKGIARFFLFVSDWGKEEKHEIKKLKNCEITIIDVAKYLHYFSSADIGKYTNTYIKSLTPYYRLLIPKILPGDVDKVFYIDGDMIVDTDLLELYNALPNDKLMAAVVELFANADHKKTLGHLRKWDEFAKYNSNRFDAPYFNAGFFLMNLKLARKLNLFGDFMNFLKNHSNPPYADQDTLNAICGQKYSDKMIYLPPEYNLFCNIDYIPPCIDFYLTAYKNSWNEIKHASNYPKVLHYCGPDKPWMNEKMLHYRNVWWVYNQQSPFGIESLPLQKNKENFIKSILKFNMRGAKHLALHILPRIKFLRTRLELHLSKQCWYWFTIGRYE